MFLAADIKSILENEFDIPFIVKIDYRQQEPNFMVVPAVSHDHLFTLNVCFKNQIRMEMQLEPQKYAAEMVREMGSSDPKKKDLFCLYASQLVNSGAKVVLRVNDTVQAVSNWEKWPPFWEKLFLKVNIRPIEIDEADNPDYFATVQRWLPVMMGLSLSLLRVERVENEQFPSGKTEGRKFDVITTKYERNPVNRVLCLAKYGYCCSVCGFDFEKTYGLLGKEFIHVHHKTPVSKMGDDYLVNPIEDMIPVCPNCHAMLHKVDPPIAPERLKEIIQEQVDR